MLKDLQTYETWISAQLQKSVTKETIEYHAQKIQYFQHERLVHLLVTLTIGIALLISVLATLSMNQLILYIIDGLLFILFVPYIFHYRGLENGIQRLYKISDQFYRI